MDSRQIRAFVAFLEAVYRLDTDDERWMRDLVTTGRAVSGGGEAAFVLMYDASDVAAFRQVALCFEGPDGMEAALAAAPGALTPAYVARTFRSLLVDAFTRTTSAPELDAFFARMQDLGFSDSLAINGLDPTGVGVLLQLCRREPQGPSAEDMAMYRRMAHHLAAAHRCRCRLGTRKKPTDPADGAEAILNARGRVLHAAGAATTKAAQTTLIEASKARDLARSSRADRERGLQRWWPLTDARWTLVDTFERSGARYIVARENQAHVQGLGGLSERERQVVAYAALGQSTKETAYALGISDITVRVLLSRAAAKLGVKTRARLIEHPDVRALSPGGRGPAAD